MNAAEIMTKRVITVRVDTSTIRSAWRIATARHLKARDVMTKRVVTVVNRTPVDILATLISRRKVKRVPLLQNGELVGIVSRTDVLEALMRRADAADECP